MFQELKAQELKPKEIYAQIAQKLKISVRSARSYVWRAQNPEAYQEMLKRYFAKRKTRLAAEAKKAKAKKPKKKKKAKKPKTEEAPAEEPKDLTKQDQPPVNPWTK